MKIACFHLMPYRDLADDFEKKYKSAWFSLPFNEVADAGTALAHSEVFMLPHCGHEPPLEQMELLRDKVTSFLAAGAL